jgi:hypothetical protein
MITTTITYIMYAILSVGLTVWVGRVLFTHGRIFIIDSLFSGESSLVGLPITK